MKAKEVLRRHPWLWFAPAAAWLLAAGLAPMQDGPIKLAFAGLGLAFAWLAGFGHGDQPTSSAQFKTPAAEEMRNYRRIGEFERGKQCAVYGCAEPGTGFTDDQWWICREHYEHGYSTATGAVAAAALRAVADDEAEQSYVVTLNNGETHRVVPVWHLYSEATRLDPPPLADWERALLVDGPQKCECPAANCPVEHHR